MHPVVQAAEVVIAVEKQKMSHQRLTMGVSMDAKITNKP
jgi:hypothetical protein